MDLWEVRMRMAEELAEERGLGCVSETSLVQKYGPGGPWVYEYDDE